MLKRNFKGQCNGIEDTRAQTDIINRNQFVSYIETSFEVQDVLHIFTVTHHKSFLHNLTGKHTSCALTLDWDHSWQGCDMRAGQRQLLYWPLGLWFSSINCIHDTGARKVNWWAAISFWNLFGQKVFFSINNFTIFQAISSYLIELILSNLM